MLEEGQTGRCRARKCVDGKSVIENYGKLTSMALDPIEKKPLSMFMPGSKVLSVGSFGCNLNCPFCQNCEISMAGEKDIETVYVSPELLVDKAMEFVGRGNIGLAFTYNEPLVGFEYVRDSAKLAHEKGLKNVVVTNGEILQETASKVIPYIDAMNIDLKGFTDEFYDFVGGSLSVVKDFIILASRSCHVEITTLIVPGRNDNEGEMDELSSWIASVDDEIPLHVTRFFPRYRMSSSFPTPVEKVYALADTARKNLKYVFEGNC